MALSYINIEQDKFRDWVEKTNIAFRTINEFGDVVSKSVGSTEGSIPLVGVGNVIDHNIIPKASWADYRDRTNNRFVTAKSVTAFTFTQSLIWS